MHKGIRILCFEFLEVENKDTSFQMVSFLRDYFMQFLDEHKKKTQKSRVSVIVQFFSSAWTSSGILNIDHFHHRITQR
jgi:hypothetical protein